jgi:hypothetical protein
MTTFYLCSETTTVILTQLGHYTSYYFDIKWKQRYQSFLLFLLICGPEDEVSAFHQQLFKYLLQWEWGGGKVSLEKGKGQEDSPIREKGGKFSSQLPNSHTNHRNLKQLLKSISQGFTKKENSHSGSLARIYLAKQDKVERNKKGKKEHLQPNKQEKRAEKF